MIKDLIENSVNLVRKKHIDLVKEKVQAEVYHKIITSIIKEEENTLDIESELESECKESNETNNDESSNFSDILNHDRYDELYEQIKNTKLDNKEIEIEIEEEQNSNGIMGFDMTDSNQYIQIAGFNISDMLNKVLGKKNTKKNKNLFIDQSLLSNIIL
jgi:ATP-dependent protease HslVU (ClpYQ) ATPase subunit